MPIYLAVWSFASVVLGAAIGIALYRLGRRHAGPAEPPPVPVPEPVRYPPGQVYGCVLCGVPTECGAVVSLVTDQSHAVTGPLCEDCWQMRWHRPAEFRDGILKRAREGFGGRD